MGQKFLGGALFATTALLAATSCTTANDGLSAPPALNWAASGYLTASSTTDPEIIGLYASRSECEAAVADWLSRQVVGNPISGDCLPIDPE